MLNERIKWLAGVPSVNEAAPTQEEYAKMITDALKKAKVGSPKVSRDKETIKVAVGKAKYTIIMSSNEQGQWHVTLDGIGHIGKGNDEQIGKYFKLVKAGSDELDA